ncbi:MAG: hypothetical protein JXB13_01060 [Phycisphaerae bacterium]|nr:hypothetical protein [Phycisphaerae bacterium]
MPIEYELPADGYATLVVEQADGTRVRNLISDYPRRQGKNTDYWDGADDEGRLVSPGEYRVRGLFHGDLDVRYQFHFGNPSDTPQATADGKGGWLSNHCNHFGILADKDRIYVSAPEAEGPYPLIALDTEGNKEWGALARWHAGPMARCGDYLYTVNDRECRPARSADDIEKEAPIELIRLDPKTGHEALFPDKKSKHVIATWNVQEQGGAKKWDGWMVENHAHDADWLGLNPQGLAALDGTLYVSLRFNDKLLKVDAEAGNVVGEIKLQRPSGLASDGRRLLAVSGKEVVHVDTGGNITPVITENLKAPVGLALDAKGNIYVSDWADQMVVKVFSPDGTYLKSIGKPGGRPWVGPYDRSGMLLPSGISVDPKGRLWVAENDFSPRRVSCWDTATGELILERLGRGLYGGYGYFVLPDKPEQGILMNNLVDLDWTNGRWRAKSTLWRGTKADELLGFDPYTRPGKVIYRDGRRLLLHSSYNYWRGVTIVSELTDDGRAKPLAAVGPVMRALPVVGRFQGGAEPPPFLAERLWSEPVLNTAAKNVIPWFFNGPCAGNDRSTWFVGNLLVKEARTSGWKAKDVPFMPRPNNNFCWSDLDGDGAVDADEVHFYTTPELKGSMPPFWSPESWSRGLADENLTLYFTAIDDGKAHHFRLPVAQWADSGVPMYDPAKAEMFVVSPYMGEAAWLTADGNLLTLANIPGKGRPERQRDPLVMYRADGSIAWTFPSPWTGVHGSHTAPKEKRGQLVGPLGVCGSAILDGVGEIFAFHSNVGTAEIFTSDGLYLGRLFRDGRSAPDPWPESPRRGQSLKNVTNGGEWFGGEFFQRPDGKMFVVCSRSSGVIAEVTGMETARRLAAQPLAFTTEQYEAAQKLQAESKADQKQQLSMQVAGMKTNPETAPSLPSFRWDSKHSASWRYDQTRGAQASWGYDDKNLYVAFQVEDDTPMVNSGEDLRQLFKFGDAAILELRTHPDETSPRAAEGDLRLLFSVHQGNPVAVLYDYRHPGARAPVELTSVKTTRIDRLETMEQAIVDIQRTGDGYTLCAAVPLADLGWAPKPGITYPGDFGIVYSDKTGQINELRMYWSNKATGIVSDLSLEADIQPGNWGRFEVK